MSTGKPGLFRAVLAVAVSVFAAGLAIAQELEDIVVTATRREQSLQDVGVSVTAFSDQQIREFGFTNTVDVTAMTPNLNYTVPNAEASQINFFLRGVGLNDFADAQENPVAVYVDDVYKPAMGGLHQQLFDVDRIEVLRGPQGGLFGRNTTGGVIHYITRKPTEEFEAYVDASYGRFDQIKAEGAVSGGLTDWLLGRLSASVNEHDGWTENRTPGRQDFNGADAYAVRGQLLLKATDDLEFLVSANYSDNDAEVGAWQHQATKPSADGNVSLPLAANDDFWTFINGGAVGADAFGYQDRDGDPWDGDYDRDGSVQVENTAFSGTIDWRIGGLDFTSITAYTEVDRNQEEDTEMNPFAAFLGFPSTLSFVAPTFAAETETFSQELRLADNEGPFRWLAGVYYFDNDVDAEYDLDATIVDFVLLDTNYHQDTEAIDIFASVEYDLSDQWTVLASLRWSNEEKELDFRNTDLSGVTAFCSTQPDPQAVGCFNPAPTPFGTPVRPTPDDQLFFSKNTVGDLAEFDDDYWTGKAELDWKPTEDLLFYGSISRGQKSPGFNSGFLDITQVFGNNPIPTVPFDEETLWAYEIGGKSTIFDGTTRLNASAFYYDYEDFQTFQFLLLNQVIFNTDAEVYGFEVEMTTAPIEGLDIGVDIGYLDAEAEDIPTLTQDRVEDRDMVAAPEWSLNGYARYEWPALGGTMSIMGWGNYVKDIYYDIQNHPISKEDDYTVMNVRGSYLSGSERWEVYGEVLNVFDEEYRKYTFDFTGTFGFNQEAYGAPQWWRAGVRLNFGGGI